MILSQEDAGLEAVADEQTIMYQEAFQVDEDVPMPVSGSWLVSEQS